MFGAELEYAAKDWLVLKEAEGKRPDTIRAYGEHLHIFLKWLAGRELTPFAFVTFFRDYRQDHAVKSCQTIYTTMRTFLKGIGQLDLAGQMKKPEGDVPPKKVYTEGQLRALFLLLRADLSPTILRNHAIVCLLRYCGVRASEVCRLRLDDLIGHEDLVKIRGGKSRYAKARHSPHLADASSPCSLLDPRKAQAPARLQRLPFPDGRWNAADQKYPTLGLESIGEEGGVSYLRPSLPSYLGHRSCPRQDEP